MRSLFELALALTLACLVACSGSDGDGNPVSVPDADGDGISDEAEGAAEKTDTDGDGTPDYLDDDADGDGIPDAVEVGGRGDGEAVDSDFDGTPDFRDTDSDDNGVPDATEGAEDPDGDSVGNYADSDNDGDNLGDKIELGLDPSMPPDSDDDGTLDYLDTDSDNDTIRDIEERSGDPDGDEIPSYLDLDSDDDCIPDAVEAGDADPATPARNSDNDFAPDYVDFDSDNDAVLDSDEDLNCDGIWTPGDGETNPLDEDSDADGASDLIENAAGTDPNNGADNPAANGDFIFVVPYEEPPSPPDDTLDFATDLVQADVIFAMDTTGSMRHEIDNLKVGLSALVGTIQSQIPNVAFSIVAYDDFPILPYGNASSGDEPFELLHRVMTATTAAGLASIQAAVDSYASGHGEDGPESGFEMLSQLATGAGTTEGNASVPAFNPLTAPPLVLPPGETVGTAAGVGVREGSLPIVVWFTDACNHNADDGSNPYGAGDDPAVASPTQTEATNDLLGVAARVLGVFTSNGACQAIGRLQQLSVVNATGAVVPPTAWGPAGSRPAGCSVGECCTGEDGDGEPAQAGVCPLQFSVDGEGNGLGDAVADAVRSLAQFGELDIGAAAADDPSDAVDAVASFVARIEANPLAGAPCASGLTSADRLGGDGIDDTFVAVIPGTRVCFDVVPKVNSTVPATSVAQMFRAHVIVSGDGVTELDQREIFFLVPPDIPDIVID